LDQKRKLTLITKLIEKHFAFTWSRFRSSN